MTVDLTRDYFHVGLLVPDLAKARERFEQALGFVFAATRDAVFSVRTDGGEPEEVALSVTYSRNGSPHIELIEAIAGGGPFGRANCGVHHLGRWVRDPVEVSQRASALGVRSELIVSDVIHYLDPRDLFGIRFELCPIEIADDWADWVQPEATANV